MFWEGFRGWDVEMENLRVIVAAGVGTTADTSDFRGEWTATVRIKLVKRSHSDGKSGKMLPKCEKRAQRQTQCAGFKLGFIRSVRTWRDVGHKV